jgi:hypothetical protein
LTYYTGISLEQLRETTDKINQNSRRFDQEVNPALNNKANAENTTIFIIKAIFGFTKHYMTRPHGANIRSMVVKYLEFTFPRERDRQLFLTAFLSYNNTALKLQLTQPQLRTVHYILYIPEAHPASCTMGTGSFPGGVRCGWGVTLTPHPLLVSWSKREWSYTSTLPKGLHGL